MSHTVPLRRESAQKKTAGTQLQQIARRISVCVRVRVHSWWCELTTRGSRWSILTLLNSMRNCGSNACRPHTNESGDG